MTELWFLAQNKNQHWMWRGQQQVFVTLLVLLFDKRNKLSLILLSLGGIKSKSGPELEVWEGHNELIWWFGLLWINSVLSVVSHWARGHDRAICDVSAAHSQMNGNAANSTQSLTFSVGLKWKIVKWKGIYMTVISDFAF